MHRWQACEAAEPTWWPPGSHIPVVCSGRPGSTWPFLQGIQVRDERLKLMSLCSCLTALHATGGSGLLSTAPVTSLAQAQLAVCVRTQPP